MLGHPTRKRFGQNFLADPHYVARIIAAIVPRRGENIVEIGPGFGALTRPLIDACGHISGVEIDRDLAARLAAEYPSERLSLHVTDALRFDFATLGHDLRVIGNLPYNISTPLLFHLAYYAAIVRDITVMLQKEVVQRMVAAPATEAYGRLSVMLQARFAIERLFVVPGGAFRPVPKVESALARLVPLGSAQPYLADAALFGKLVTAAFGQRRKTLRNALRDFVTEVELEREGIAPGARGETLSVADYVRLANALARPTARE